MIRFVVVERSYFIGFSLIYRGIFINVWGGSSFFLVNVCCIIISPLWYETHVLMKAIESKAIRILCIDFISHGAVSIPLSSLSYKSMKASPERSAKKEAYFKSFIKKQKPQKISRLFESSDIAEAIT